MGVKFKTTKDEFPSMKKAVEALNGKKVSVGVLKGESQWLASIHEYGCKIPVTPKMRAFLHSQGIHLKKSTKVITIPERSFLRAGFDEHHEDVLDSAERALPQVLDGKMSADQYLDNVGLMLSSKIKEYAIDMKDPPKSGATLQMNPGFTNPLIQTGDMVGGITWEVED